MMAVIVTAKAHLPPSQEQCLAAPFPHCHIPWTACFHHSHSPTLLSCSHSIIPTQQYSLALMYITGELVMGIPYWFTHLFTPQL